MFMSIYYLYIMWLCYMICSVVVSRCSCPSIVYILCFVLYGIKYCCKSMSMSIYYLYIMCMCYMVYSVVVSRCSCPSIMYIVCVCVIWYIVLFVSRCSCPSIMYILCVCFIWYIVLLLVDVHVHLLYIYYVFVLYGI